MTRPTVTVAICCYTQDRWRRLVAAVESAATQHPRPTDVLVVVDHDVVLLNRAQRSLGDQARCISNTGPQGLSGARNTALSVARTDVIAYLDDDAAALPGWLGALLAPFEDPSVLAVGGSSTPLWERQRPGWFPDEFDWVVGSSYRGMPTRRTDVRNVIGCNMAFRRAPLDGAGGFDPALGRVGRKPMGAEETEACIRLLARNPGGRVVYEPLARVSHHVPPPRSTFRYFMARCWSEGRSKAILTRMAGTGRGLATERRYVLRTLPAGVMRHGAEALRGDRAGITRAVVIGAGLASTVSGYAVEKAAGAVHRRRNGDDETTPRVHSASDA